MNVIRCRQIDNGDSMVLNVSPPFTTALNGVAFTWALRLCDECVVAAPGENGEHSCSLVTSPCDKIGKSGLHCGNTTSRSAVGRMVRLPLSLFPSLIMEELISTDNEEIRQMLAKTLGMVRYDRCI